MSSSIHGDGLGWLTHGEVGFAYWALLSLQIVLSIRSLYLVWRAEPMDKESFSFLMFAATMVLLPFAALIGIDFWFATKSILLGVGGFVTAVLLGLMMAINTSFT